MNILYGILATPFIIWFFFRWTFGGGTKRPPAAKDWQCSAHHNHQTPEAARKCSAAQLRG